MERFNRGVLRYEGKSNIVFDKGTPRKLNWALKRELKKYDVLGVKARYIDKDTFREDLFDVDKIIDVGIKCSRINFSFSTYKKGDWLRLVGNAPNGEVIEGIEKAVCDVVFV